MKKIVSLLIFLFITFAGFTETTSAITITVVDSKADNEVSRGEVFRYLSTFLSKDIPESYKYIQLNYKNLDKESKLYDSLQKLVYYDIIANTETKIHESKKLNMYGFLRLAEKTLGFPLINSEEITALKSRNTTKSDIRKLEKRINRDLLQFQTVGKTAQIKNKKAILVDVYNNLIETHYNKDELDQENMLNKAIEGLAKGVDDKYTVYFPPTESESFNDILNGEYEGIGAYVDMETPGVLVIVTPIKGSPSEKAGLKGGDIVTKVDGKLITEKNSITEVVSWIKGPAGTTVNLTIQRGEQILEIGVVREKIVITDVDSKLLDSSTYYIEIKSFGDHVFTNFTMALEDLKKQKSVDKIIIDLRNNGGGYLDQVSKMLGYFVPKDEPTAVVKYQDSTEIHTSLGFELVDFSKYKIVILQNSGTASASEIMIGTLKDYYDNITIIGEKSFGKGSVQTIRKYSDGSALKYTIAKWFTGKTETGIDGIGISPDIELELNLEDFNKYNRDNQLDKARVIR